MGLQPLVHGRQRRGGPLRGLLRGLLLCAAQRRYPGGHGIGGVAPILQRVGQGLHFAHGGHALAGFFGGL